MSDTGERKNPMQYGIMNTISRIFALSVAIGVWWHPSLLHAEVLSGKVVRVADGDTINVRSEGTIHRIRLAGIDAPEENQPYFYSARDALSKLLLEKSVIVRWNHRDAYNRIVGQVFLDHLDVNQEMVRRGFAWWYRRFARGNTILEQLEQDARTHRRGVWHDSLPIAPWRYRSGERTLVLLNAVVKKSRKGICHVPGSKYYHTVERYDSFISIKTCLASGGRLPAEG